MGLTSLRWAVAKPDNANVSAAEVRSKLHQAW